MTPLPPPPVPADLDLRDFPFMPLDVLRLRDSNLTTLATGDEFKAAVLLWCAAWHQVPAGSVPNDDRWLTRHSGAGNKWRKVKVEALRGFAEYADGRLYHAVVVEKALSSWQRKSEQRVRTLKARIKAMENRLAEAKTAEDKAHLQAMLTDMHRSLSQAIERSVTDPSTDTVTGPVTASVTDRVTETKGQGEGEGDSNLNGANAPRAVDDLALPAFLDRRQDPDAGTGRASNIDLATIVFAEGLNWLRSRTGKPEGTCRKLLGKWRKDLGNDEALIAALGAAQREGVIDPVAWMEGAIKARRANGQASPRASWAENLP